MLGIFKKKESMREYCLKLKEKHEDRINKEIRKLKRFMKVGETFDYLGTKMMVIHIAHAGLVIQGVYYNNACYAYMKVEYMTSNGIKEKEFGIHDLPLLKKLNKK